MAADVREADSVVIGESCQQNEGHCHPVPSHIIVQNQLKDIIEAQNEVVVRLSQNVDLDLYF